MASFGKEVNFFELCVDSCEFSVICLNVVIVCGFLLQYCSAIKKGRNLYLPGICTSHLLHL